MTERYWDWPSWRREYWYWWLSLYRYWYPLADARIPNIGLLN